MNNNIFVFQYFYLPITRESFWRQGGEGRECCRKRGGGGGGGGLLSQIWSNKLACFCSYLGLLREHSRTVTPMGGINKPLCCSSNSKFSNTLLLVRQV